MTGEPYVRSWPVSRPVEAPRPWVRRVEDHLVARPGLLKGIRRGMVALYLALLGLPLIAPPAPENATAFTHIATFSYVVFWYLWWPSVVLSMLLFGRAWCGLLCPEGTLSAAASRHGGNRPVPRWMRWGGIPLVAFIGITVYGQLIGVYEYPWPQALILGGSTVLAVTVNLIYTRKGWVWCRFLCPVSLLFGVFSRLGALHFAVDQRRASAPGGGTEKEPCPVFIYLPKKSSNRDCLMCFRCSGWKDAIHLDWRKPGAELAQIESSQPMGWEVAFLLVSLGLPLGVFHWTVSPLFARLKFALGERALDLGLGRLIGWQGPWWIMSHHPEAGEVFNLLDAVSIAAFILGAVAIVAAVVGGLVALAAWLTGGRPVRERMIWLGYAFAPLSLFSLFLGLSQLTFGAMEARGWPTGGTEVVRLVFLCLGAAWTLALAWRTAATCGARGLRRVGAAAALGLGVVVILGAWWPVLF